MGPRAVGPWQQHLFPQLPAAAAHPQSSRCHRQSGQQGQLVLSQDRALSLPPYFVKPAHFGGGSGTMTLVGAWPGSMQGESTRFFTSCPELTVPKAAA